MNIQTRKLQYQGINPQKNQLHFLVMVRWKWEQCGALWIPCRLLWMSDLRSRGSLSLNKNRLVEKSNVDPQRLQKRVLTAIINKQGDRFVTFEFPNSECVTICESFSCFLVQEWAHLLATRTCHPVRLKDDWCNLRYICLSRSIFHRDGRGSLVFQPMHNYALVSTVIL